MKFLSTLLLLLTSLTTTNTAGAVRLQEQERKSESDIEKRELRNRKSSSKGSSSSTDYCWGDPEENAYSSLFEVMNNSDACLPVNGNSDNNSVNACIARGGHALVPFWEAASNGQWLFCCDPCAIDRELVQAQCTPSIGNLNGPDRGCRDATGASGIAVVTMVNQVSAAIGDRAYCCLMTPSLNAY